MAKSICIIVQNYYEIAPRIRIETRALVEQGYKVDVISLRRENSTEKEYPFDGASISTIPVSKKRGSKWQYIWEYLTFFIRAFLLLTKRAFVERYDFVQVCNLPDFLVFSAIVQKLLGATIVFDMVEIMPEFYASKFDINEDHFIIRILKWQEKLCTIFSDKIIVINDPIKELLINRGIQPDKMTVVMNSADNLLFNKTITGGDQIKDDNAFIMMYHGTLTSLYGLDIALKAFKLAKPHLSNAEFWLLGNGPELERLNSLSLDLDLSDNVKFLGSMPQHDMPAWLMKCDVGILATRQDIFSDLSFSSKLPEFILMGKPVIMSRLKSISRYFREESLAFFEPHNEADLARQMIGLYKNPTARSQFAINALNDYEEINWTVMKQRYLSVYN